MDNILCPKIPYQKLREILQELCHPDSQLQENWTSLIQNAVRLSDSLTQTLCVDIDSRHQLEKLAVHLWNKTAILKTKVEKDLYGKLRYICFQVIAFLNESGGNVDSMKRQIMMGLKTTRAWIDVKEFVNAEKILCNLNETIQRMQRSLIEMKNVAEVSEDDVEKQISETTKDFFYILSLKAEVKFAQGQNKEAILAVKKAEEITSSFPNEADNLSMLCYNFGVDCYQSRDYMTAVTWLRESCSISKDIADPNPKTQARTLRLLANCYMEAKCADWKENALNAVSLANQKYPHVAGLYVRLQLLLETEESGSSLQHALQELMDHCNFDMDLCINVLRLFKTSQRSDAIFEARHKLLQKFEQYQNIGSLQVTLLDTLFQASDASVAQIFAEECITAHNTGQTIEGMSLKQFHILFWMKAAQYYEKHKFEKAAVWYNYSLSLYPSMSTSEPNLAKLQRNLANCYFNLGDFEKALAAIEIAERCDKKDAHTQYIIFKIALEQGNVEKATASLRLLVEYVENHLDSADVDIICLVAQTALERNCSEMAIIALECLISHSNKDKQVLTALQALVRLLLHEMESNDSSYCDKKRLLCHIRTAFNKILSSKDQGKLATAEIEDEATWFMKIAWNLAIQCKEDPFCMKEFFNLCIQLLSLCEQNDANFHRHQNCLVMSCAACLQLARDPQSMPQLQDLLEEVLQHIEEHKQAERKAQQSPWCSAGSTKTDGSAELLLMLYEFEALAKLKDPRAEAVLDRALTLHNPSPKLFHTFSVLAMDAPAKNKKLSMRALKVAIKLHMQAEQPDFVKCSADIRNLISMALVSNEKEAMIYFKETLDMIEKKGKEQYPEIELLWLMTKSWNCGLQHFNWDKPVEAEQWCALSISMLKYLPSSKQEYHDQMMSVYGEILNCIETSVKRKHMEE